VAKGLEGFLAGMIGATGIAVFLLPLAGLCMVAVYFIAELFLPGVGLAAALSEVPFNLIQAFVGAFGGYLVFKAVLKALPKKKDRGV
jgi:hypothetical protein